MTVKYQFTFDELKALYRSRAASRQRSTSGINYYWYGVVPAITVLVALMSGLGVALTAMVLFFGSGQIFNYSHAKRVWAATLTPENLATLILPVTATVTDDGISFESEAYQIFYRWRYVQSVSRSGAQVQVNLSALTIHSIPKRAFGDDRERDEFVAYCSQRIEAHKA